MFLDIIIMKHNYDMYMLRSYSIEHWQQRAGGEEENRHAILRLCSSKTSAFNAVVLRRPRLDVGTQKHVETSKRTAGTGTRDRRRRGNA